MFVLTDRKVLRNEIIMVQPTFKVDAKHFLSRIMYDPKFLLYRKSLLVQFYFLSKSPFKWSSTETFRSQMKDCTSAVGMSWNFYNIALICLTLDRVKSDTKS